MTRDEMTMLLRSVCCDGDTIRAMETAFDMGADYEKERILAVIGDNQCECNCADVVRGNT